jgi:hypothetical protein
MMKQRLWFHQQQALQVQRSWWQWPCQSYHLHLNKQPVISIP